jgi:type IX secretion system PorP/SprF family membrane protein
MKRSFTTLLLMGFLAGSALAQQDAMLTKYMFNSLAFNPAYAGSREHLSTNMLYRSQWVGSQIEGAPETQVVSAHTPLTNERVGVGLSLARDVIGPTNTISAAVSYAYRIPITKTSKLSVGLQGGVMSWRANWAAVTRQQVDDPAFADSPSLLLPNFGFGLYYYTKNFYAGASVPQLIQHDLRKNNDALAITARQYRHFYAMVGAALPVKGDDIIFKPSVLVRNVGWLNKIAKDSGLQNVGAPTEFNLDLSLLFYQAFWIGGSFRSAIEAFGANSVSSYDSGDVWASYVLKNGLRIGAAYDYPLVSKIGNLTPGSFELMLGYEFDYKEKRTSTPRYF